MPHSSHVNILMGTYNGAAFLQPQLDSFLAQSHDDWSLWISDDGSNDGTMAILERFRAKHPARDIRILQGPCQGVARNYLSLLARPIPAGALVALSDQDDVWLPDKLIRAVRAIAAAPKPGPVAYAGARHLATADLHIQGQSLPVRRGPSFGNALVQNILPGHSLVLNSAAHDLVAAAGQPKTVMCHDWWIYLLVSGAGGQVLYDPEPLVIYRQHHGNFLGSNRGRAARLRRAALVWNYDYGRWMQGNLQALMHVSACLTPQNRAIVQQLVALGRRAGLVRAWQMARLGLRRQTWAGTLAVLLAAAMGRL